MKKLLLGLLGTVIILSFKPKMDANIQHPITSSDTICTLNGYSLAEARRMVFYCDTTQDKAPKNTQIWFRREIIDSIYAMLKLELNNTIKPDGVRIYFARADTAPIHANNKVVIVSTYYDGITYEDGAFTKIHRDYFNHSKMAGLFKLKDINGKITHENNKKNGTLLYNTCNCDNPNACVVDPKHDIPRSKAEKMVGHFHRIIIFRKGTINSRAEWFGLDMIEKLVEAMKKNNDDGIRIYFARGIDNDYTKRKAKFVIVETHPDTGLKPNKNIHRDFFDCTNPFANKYPYRTTALSLLDQSFLTTYGNLHNLTQSRLMEIMASSGGGLDNGEICPTHCTGVTLPQ